ncbi:MAG: DUF4160 domain-containing protein [Deltaproteobacteria bacterium]|nr:DUF4160 domain-containing protein [Deltaproteobacteria bacterium]
MGKVKRGGYTIYFWIGDHDPKHVHVLEDGKLIAKVRVSDLSPLRGAVSNRLKKILATLKKEKKI